jgi:hypothetical protein
MGGVLFNLSRASPQWSSSFTIDQQCRKMWSLNFVVVYFSKTLELSIKCCLYLFQIHTILEQLHNIPQTSTHHVWWYPISFLKTLLAILHMLWNDYCCNDPSQNVALFYTFLITESCEMCNRFNTIGTLCQCNFFPFFSCLMLFKFFCYGPKNDAIFRMWHNVNNSWCQQALLTKLGVVIICV